MTPQYQHAVLSRPTADEQGREAFLAAMRRYLITDLYAGNALAYNRRAKPAFEKAQGRAPATYREVKAAMDAESERAQAMGAKMLSGQKIDMQALVKDAGKIKSADQTIQEVLTPDQKTAYQSMQADEKKSRAETSASLEMNQVAPMLNLNENQKDQVESALYQVQIDSQDPKWLQQHSSSTPGDPTAYLDAEEKAKEDALTSLLTPDQMTAYKQQQQSQLDMQKAMMKKFMPTGGFSAAVTSTTTGVAPSPSPTPTP